ncbi:MAG: family 78 glycoside hydrolase catalytic domain [Alistipes sp.]|nr:family 78 glycoside hydrolase catalytic domain [Alistipes sp.]
MSIKRGLLFASLLLMGQVAMAQGLNVEGLKTEHLESPLGVDKSNPRLSWRMTSAREGAAQSSYRVMVGRDSLALVQGKCDVWDSGNKLSADMWIRYGGEALQPRTRYYWQVAVTDESGATAKSAVASFETGKMTLNGWVGNWISDNKSPEHSLAPYFRKKFNVNKSVSKARLYVAVAGLYNLHLNGQRMGDAMLEPVYTRFDRRNMYVTYDVTPFIRDKENVVGIVLGNGWYNHQALGVWNFDTAPWRNRPAFCLDLHITYEDGTEEVVSTDLSWRSTDRGPLVRNNIYTGEHYDFTKQLKGWDSPGYDDSKWGGVKLRSLPSEQLTSQQMRPIRACREYKAVKFTKLQDGVYLYDFGYNMAGVTSVSLRGEKGAVVKLRHGERLGKDGRLDQSNIDVYYRGDKEKDPFQTDILTLSGEADEFMSSFNYKGFRYVQIEASAPIEIDEGSLVAYFVHSDVPQVGTISSSNKLIEGLMAASNQAYLSNLMGYPTDCPQREKNGWTGDGHLAIEAALYNFDGITVYEKWMADHRDEQQPNGVLPDIIPTGGWGYGTDNGLDWTSTIAIIPWNLYLFYGDDEALRQCYPHIKRYVDYVGRISRGNLTTWGRGDWVPVTVGSNKELTSSVYYYADACILARAAKMLGKQADYEKYSALSEQIKKSINDKYLNTETGIYANGTQTELSVPLYWGVVPDEYKAKVAKNLNEKVIASEFHLDVGVLGCKALLNALCENGYTDTAYKVAIQDTYPSWGWWVKNGATTLLENWKLDATRDISDNHMMFGEIGAWFYKGLAGIYPDSEQPGFKHINLRPYFPDGLEEFTARHTSPYGEIVSGWSTKGSKVLYQVTIPANSTATLTLPAGWSCKEGEKQELKAGTYLFTCKKR